METNTSRDAEKVVPRARRRSRILLWSLVAVGGLCAILALLVVISAKTFRHLYANAPDPILSYRMDRTVKVGIPGWIPAEIRADEAIPVKLSKVLEMEIPIKRNVAVVLDDDFVVPVDTTVTVPIDQEIHVEAEIPVETTIPLDGIRVETSLWGLKRITLPLSGSFPVRTSITLNRKIHVKTEAHVRIQKDVKTHVSKRLVLPLDLVVNVQLPINDVFDVRLGAPLQLNARLPDEMPVHVNMRLALTKEDGIVTD